MQDEKRIAFLILKLLLFIHNIFIYICIKFSWMFKLTRFSFFFFHSLLYDIKNDFLKHIFCILSFFNTLQYGKIWICLRLLFVLHACEGLFLLEIFRLKELPAMTAKRFCYWAFRNSYKVQKDNLSEGLPLCEKAHVPSFPWMSKNCNLIHAFLTNLEQVSNSFFKTKRWN